MSAYKKFKKEHPFLMFLAAIQLRWDLFRGWIVKWRNK